MYSSQKNDLENSKNIYGDWHYAVSTGHKMPDVQNKDKGDGYEVEQCGHMVYCDYIEEPLPLYFLKTDEDYRQMTHREITEGRYPEKGNEIAADYYTLGNLGYDGKVGGTIVLGGKNYILSGILKGEWAASADKMEIFAGEDYAGKENQNYLYLRFAEDRKLYQQMDAFQKDLKISGDAVKNNEEVTAYLSGEQPESIYDIVKFALTDERGNFTYIILKLQSGYNLSYNGMIFLLCVFSLFIIYSIFNISVSRRVSEYGIMQTLGISEKRISGTLILELWMLLAVGYPLGCLLGNGLLKIFFGRLNGIFTEETARTATKLSKADQVFGATGAADAEFYTALNAVWAGFLFLMAAFVVIGFLMVSAMRKRTLRELMSADHSFKKKRREICSREHSDLARKVIRRFMFSKKRKVIGILLSLSIGGCIFLCTTYMVENLKIHAELSLKSDDGLGSEYRISVKSAALSDTIPDTVVEKIRKNKLLSKVYATKYTLGELTIRKEELEWDSYFEESNQNSYYQDRFGGICVDKGDGRYGIKYNVYGYDPEMIMELQDFILEGSIEPEALVQGNQIIAVANKDGQGNYNFYGKHPGDVIRLRVPRDLNCSGEVLKFQSGQENYVEKEFVIAAIVSRALAQEESFLNAAGWENSQSIIMTSRQMQEAYGIQDYSFINASPKSGVDTDKISSLLLQEIKDVPKAVLKDYTTAIETQKNYLEQQQLFFSGIAVILLVISLFHIINSMNYSILARRREFGIMRAMGITDARFYKMILEAGILYGILADVFIFLIYHVLLRKIMDYYMMHVVQFLHLSAGVPGGVFAAILVLNMIIAVTAVMVPARKLVESNIISEIGR